MSIRHWVPTVLRARQAQEDLVAQRVALARRDAGLAADQLSEHAARLATMVTASSRTAMEFQAEAASQQAAAATVAAAANRVMFAEARVGTAVAELTEAARSRRVVEKLHESDQAELQANVISIAQREQDEISISRHGADRRAAG